MLNRVILYRHIIHCHLESSVSTWGKNNNSHYNFNNSSFLCGVEKLRLKLSCTYFIIIVNLDWIRNHSKMTFPYVKIRGCFGLCFRYGAHWKILTWVISASDSKLFCSNAIALKTNFCIWHRHWWLYSFYPGFTFRFSYPRDKCKCDE